MNLKESVESERNLSICIPRYSSFPDINACAKFDENLSTITQAEGEKDSGHRQIDGHTTDVNR